MSAERRELYVYYRVAAARWRDAADATVAWQRSLCGTHAGLTARMLRRPDENDGAVTLMEVYAFARGTGIIDAELEANIARAATELQPWLIGERHVERFDSLD